MRRFDDDPSDIFGKRLVYLKKLKQNMKNAISVMLSALGFCQSTGQSIQSVMAELGYTPAEITYALNPANIFRYLEKTPFYETQQACEHELQIICELIAPCVKN